MKIHPCQQNSLDWLIARAGLPTASELDNLITNKFAIKEGEGPKTYLARKVAEAWLNGPLPGFQSISMDIGHILEEEAIPWLEFEFSEPIQRVGFITRDDDKVGCSPDGLIGEEGGVELKCPEPHSHCKYLLNGVLPPDYGPQVYGSMYVTGRPWWKFVSYCRNFPALVLKIERDEKKEAVIHEAVEAFLIQFEGAMQRIENLAGKPRPTKTFGLPPMEPAPEEANPRPLEVFS